MIMSKAEIVRTVLQNNYNGVTRKDPIRTIANAANLYCRNVLGKRNSPGSAITPSTVYQVLDKLDNTEATATETVPVTSNGDGTFTAAPEEDLNRGATLPTDAAATYDDHEEFTVSQLKAAIEYIRAMDCQPEKAVRLISHVIDVGDMFDRRLRR